MRTENAGAILPEIYHSLPKQLPQPFPSRFLQHLHHLLRFTELLDQAVYILHFHARTGGDAAAALDLKLSLHDARTSREIDAAMTSLDRQRVDGLFVTASPMFVTHAGRIAEIAAQRGVPAMMTFLQGKRGPRPPYAPPFLKAGKLVIAQTAMILHYLGPKLGLSPRDEASRLWLHQLQLTIADMVTHIHDTHHPVSGWLYYEQQRPAAILRTKDFWRYRVPKYLGYFERIVAKSGGPYVLGRKLSYVDLSLFQIVEGLRYAFPRRMKRFERKIPRLIELHDRVANRPNTKAYLQSKSRIPFSQWGI